jgi:hypothetical protein
MEKSSALATTTEDVYGMSLEQIRALDKSSLNLYFLIHTSLLCVVFLTKEQQEYLDSKEEDIGAIKD